MIPTHYQPLAIAIALVVAFGCAFAAGWNVGADRVEARWDKAKIEQLETDRKAQAQAREKEKEYATKLQTATDEATKREQALRLEANAARAAVDGLRHAATVRQHQLPDATIAACRETAGTALTLLGSCAAEYRDMAEIADRHASDVRTLTEAWPRN